MNQSCFHSITAHISGFESEQSEIEAKTFFTTHLSMKKNHNLGLGLEACN